MFDFLQVLPEEERVALVERVGDAARLLAQVAEDVVLRKVAARGVKVQSVEGMSQGRWVLLDYVDFVVHVFHPSLRAFYQLERLWGDAPALAVSP